MKDWAIRSALAFILISASVFAETATGKEADDTSHCGAILGVEGLIAEVTPLLPAGTVQQEDTEAINLLFAKECDTEVADAAQIAACPVAKKHNAVWTFTRNKSRWLGRQLGRAVVPGLLLGIAVYGVLRGLEAIEFYCAKEQVASASAIFGMLTMKFVDAMMSPAMTPLVSKFQQLNWKVSRLLAPKNSDAASAGGLQELYPLTQHKVPLTAQAARSTWFEHAEVAELLDGHAAWLWIQKVANYKVVVPRLIALNLRRLKHKFQDVELTGDSEIEREFRVVFQNQFTFPALRESERAEFVERVLWAMEKIETEIEGEKYPLDDSERAFYRKVLTALILVPDPADDFISPLPAEEPNEHD